MIFERHKRGKVFGGEVEICPDSFLCPESHAEGSADIWQSEVYRSRIRFDSKIRQSRIEELSTVGSEKEKCEIAQSHLFQTNFYGGTALKCFIRNSIIEGFPYLRGGDITVINSIVKDRVRIEGTVYIEGVTLEEYMRIGFGQWTRPPRYLHIKTEDVELGVTESTNTHAYIRCERKPMERWIKKRSLWQKAAGWSDDICRQIILTFEEWLDVPIPTC